MANFHTRDAAEDNVESAYGTAQTAPRWDSDKPQNPFSRFTYAIGSIVSVGLVIGLGVWGYKLLVRDVSGVPVIRAAQGPMRIQPEDPGGRQTLNQGLSVNDVAALGAASAAPDELILAPAPLDLSDEDAPRTPAPTPEPEQAEQAQSDAPAPEIAQSMEPETEPEVESEVVAEAEDDVAAVPEEVVVDVPDDMLALAEAISSGISPMAELDDAPNAPPPGADEEETAEDDAEIDGGIPTSLRPRERPDDLRNVLQVAAAAPEGGARDVDPASIAVGTRLAQLGAFASEEIARDEWTRLGSRFEEYLAGKDRVIQKATSGGRTFYRLRAMGFDDLADARRFCSALVAEKAECIPVVTR